MTDKVQKIKEFLIGMAGAACCDTKTKKIIEINILPFIDSLQKEPISEELEEASKKYALNNTPWDDCVNEIQESFKAGAKWQREQMQYRENLEAKEIEIDGKFECPNIKIEDAIEVSSRMKYIDEDLKPIAEFIMDYCSWNLHKDEWSQPTIEVPLFRVLDALVQRGKPYCFR